MKSCNKCGAEILTNSKFCSECGERIQDNNGNYIKTGRKSINFIATDESKISTRDIYISPPKDSFEIDYKHVAYGKKINVSTIEKLNRFTTIITIVSGIITVITFFVPFSIGTQSGISNYIKGGLAIIALLGCAILSGLGNLLSNKSIKLPLNIELKKIDDTYISRIATVGECPICKGTVVVIKINEKDNKTNQTKEKYIGICENNQEHKFTFDNTIFKGERIK